VAKAALVDFLRNDEWGRGKWGVAKAALVDFLRNDKWGVQARRITSGVSRFPTK